MASSAVTPIRLAALTFAGVAISLVAFVSMRPLHTSVVGLTLASLLAIFGVGLVFWSPFQLRQGILNGRWPEQQTAPLRRVVGHAGWTAATFALLAVMVIAICIDPRRHSYFWYAFLLSQGMTQLSSAFRAPYRGPSTPEPLDWSSIPPLHSDHWGER